MTIMTCFGDSITDCGHCFSPDFLGDGYVKMLAERFHREGYEIQMRNCGTDGFTVQRLLQRVKTDSTIIGNLAAVLIGINDIGMMMNTDRTPAQQEEMMGSFQEHYLELLTILTKSSCSVILMEPFVFSCPAFYENWKPLLQKMSQIIRTLSYSSAFRFFLCKRSWTKKCADMDIPPSPQTEFILPARASSSLLTVFTVALQSTIMYNYHHK